MFPNETINILKYHNHKISICIAFHNALHFVYHIYIIITMNN